MHRFLKRFGLAAALVSLWSTGLGTHGQATELGVFEDHCDVGVVRHVGSV